MQAFNVSCSSVYFFSIKVFLVCHFLSLSHPVSLSTLRSAEPEPVVIPLKAKCTLIFYEIMCKKITEIARKIWRKLQEKTASSKELRYSLYYKKNLNAGW